MVQRIAAITRIGWVPVGPPHCGVNNFHVEIHVRGDVVSDTEANPLLNKLVVGFTLHSGGSIASETITNTARQHGAAKAGVVPHFRSDAQIRTEPEILEVEIFTDFW